MSDFEHISLLYGAKCPECDGVIERGSVRWNGRNWEHKNPDAHPQAGHHVFAPPEIQDIERGGAASQDAVGIGSPTKLTMTDTTELRELAAELKNIRQTMDLPPQWDGKLADAEINLRGVAEALDERDIDLPGAGEWSDL